MTTTATTTQVEFNEENFPVGTPLAWFYANLGHWQGGILRTWVNDHEAQTDLHRIYSRTDQHTIVDPPDAYTPGTRVRVARDVAVGTTGTVTTRVGTLVYFTTDDGVQESRQFWALEKVVPEFEVGDWYTYTLDGIQYGGEFGDPDDGIPEGAVKVPRFEVGDRVRLARGGEDLEGVVTGFDAAPNPIVELDGVRSGWCAWRFDKVETTTGAELADGMLVTYTIRNDDDWYGGVIGGADNVIRLFDDGTLILDTPSSPAINQESIVVVPIPQVGDRVRRNPVRLSGNTDEVLTVDSVTDSGSYPSLHFSNGSVGEAFRYDIVTDEATCQVGDLIVWDQSGDNSWRCDEVTGIDGDTITTSLGYVLPANPGPTKITEEGFTAGQRVKVVRSDSHDLRDQVGTITRVARRDNSRRSIADVEIPGMGSYCLYLYQLEDCPLTAEETEHQRLVEAVVAAENAHTEMVSKVRRMAFVMKERHDYCGELEGFLDDVGIDDRPVFGGEISVSWTFSLTDDGSSHSNLRYRRERLEARITEWLNDLDLSDVEDVTDVEAEMDVEVTFNTED